jgi:hypothetical protein
MNSMHTDDEEFDDPAHDDVGLCAVVDGTLRYKGCACARLPMEVRQVEYIPITPGISTFIIPIIMILPLLHGALPSLSADAP